ncbi:MAG: tyrosine-type recombinase/integrase [Oscillospiraceae bacterium]|nr:tyrosine-type recombinase/integrase [Oscillospiraceae bacterium]
MPRKSVTKPITLQTDASEVTFAELSEEITRFKRLRNLSAQTIRYYEDCGRYFAEFFGADNTCDKISENTFYDYIEYIHEHKPDLRPATLHSYLTGIRAILYYGMKKGYVKQFSVLLPKMDEVVKETYTDSEVMLLLKKPDVKQADFCEYRNWVLVNYLLGTGNRASTIINVKIEDVDFDSGNIILRVLKNRKQYYIPISKSLAATLREYLTYRKGEPDEYLFCTVYGKQLTLNGLENEIAKYNQRRGVQRTSLHMFRHTFAKQWILNGGDIFRLQKILGHSSLDMVRKYVNMFSDDLRRDFDSFNPLDNYLGAADKGDRISMRVRK